MIHEATVAVTCDGDSCTEAELITLEYVYHDYSGKNGEYKSDDESLEERLKDQFEWVVNDGKHYCCEECAEL